MGFVSAGDGRMFIVEQTGLIWVMQADGTILKEPFFDIGGRMVPISSRYDERGLLGLSFHPQFSENGRLFVMYSAPQERVHRRAGIAPIAYPSSESPRRTQIRWT